MPTARKTTAPPKPVSLLKLVSARNLRGLRSALNPRRAADRRTPAEIATATNTSAQHGFDDCLALLLPHCPPHAFPPLLAAAAGSGSVDILRRVCPLTSFEAHGEALRVAVQSGRQACVDFLAPIADADHIARHLARQRFECVDFLARYLDPATLAEIVAAMPDHPLVNTREHLRVHQSAAALDTATAQPGTRSRRSKRL